MEDYPSDWKTHRLGETEPTSLHQQLQGPVVQPKPQRRRELEEVDHCLPSDWSDDEKPAFDYTKKPAFVAKKDTDPKVEVPKVDSTTKAPTSKFDFINKKEEEKAPLEIQKKDEIPAEKLAIMDESDLGTEA